tara:strand:+ start:2695 stop:3606 length:912 start_codon:yes stop_codon:yes gene_type:complete
MEKPFFSVVIPTFNQAIYLEKAVNSVFKQSYKNFEIIIIDNHSTDNTENLVKNFGKNKIKYFKCKNENVIGKSRNIGIYKAEGEWIAFLDSDDTWHEERLQILFDFIQKNHIYDVICTDELIIDTIKNYKRVWRYGPYNNNFYQTLIKYGNCISTSGTIVKKKILDDNKIFFNEEKIFATADDYDLWMRLAKIKVNFKFLHKVLGNHYYFKDSGGSGKLKKIHKDAILALLKHHIFFIQNFTKKKGDLWSHVNARFIMEDIRFFFYTKNYYKFIKLLIKLFFKYPIKTIDQTNFMLKKKLFKN